MFQDSAVLSVRAPTEERSDDTKDSSYQERQHLFDQLPTYHTDVLEGDFNVQVGCLCGLVVRVPGYRSGGPGFDSGHYKKKK
jgi:hypothetical protein